MEIRPSLLIRRIVSRANQLDTQGEFYLEKGQFGFATEDKKLVIRDLQGVFHYIESDDIARFVIEESVSSASSLPNSDLIGTIRMVTDEGAYYFKSAADEWLRLAGVNYIDAILKEIKNNIELLQTKASELKSEISFLSSRTDIAEGNITTIQNNIVAINEHITSLQDSHSALAQRVSANESSISEHQKSINSINTQITSINGQISVIDNTISSIKSLISSEASPTNKLLSEREIDSKIVTLAARYLTFALSGENFPTKSSLNSAAAFYHSGVSVAPSEHDYVYVQDDESRNNGITRYSFDGTQWSLEFEVPDVNFSTPQWSAINSGITSGLVSDINDLKSNAIKTLTSGTSISVSGSGNSRTVSHANVTLSNPDKKSQSPGYSGSFDVVESVSSNAQGHITTVQTKTVTMPSAQTIPTVNNATITIQKNGTSAGSFTTNQSTNASINIALSKSDVGLGNVDNTSDADKEVSRATQAALNNKVGISTSTNNDPTISIDESGDVNASNTINETGDRITSPFNLPLSNLVSAFIQKINWLISRVNGSRTNGATRNGVLNWNGDNMQLVTLPNEVTPPSKIAAETTGRSLTNWILWLISTCNSIISALGTKANATDIPTQPSDISAQPAGSYAPANIALTATANTDTTTSTDAISSASVASVMQTMWNKIRSVVNSLASKQNTLASSTTNTISSNQIQRAALTGDITAPANSNATTLAAISVATPTEPTSDVKFTETTNVTLKAASTGWLALIMGKINRIFTRLASHDTTLNSLNTTVAAKQNTLASSTTNTISSNQIQRAALTGDVTASANSNATTLAAISVVAPTEPTSDVKFSTTTATNVTLKAATSGWLALIMGKINRIFTRLASFDTTLNSLNTTVAAKQNALASSTTNTISSNQIQRAALTGDVTAPANSNATTLAAISVATPTEPTSDVKFTGTPSVTLKADSTGWLALIMGKINRIFTRLIGLENLIATKQNIIPSRVITVNETLATNTANDSFGTLTIPVSAQLSAVSATAAQNTSTARQPLVTILNAIRNNIAWLLANTPSQLPIVFGGASVNWNSHHFIWYPNRVSSNATNFYILQLVNMSGMFYGWGDASIVIKLNDGYNGPVDRTVITYTFSFSRNNSNTVYAAVRSDFACSNTSFFPYLYVASSGSTLLFYFRRINNTTNFVYALNSVEIIGIENGSAQWLTQNTSNPSSSVFYSGVPGSYPTSFNMSLNNA